MEPYRALPDVHRCSAVYSWGARWARWVIPDLCDGPGNQGDHTPLELRNGLDTVQLRSAGDRAVGDVQLPTSDLRRVREDDPGVCPGVSPHLHPCTHHPLQRLHRWNLVD